MIIINFSNYIKESQNINENDGILIIVDVQKQFDKFTPQNFEKNIFNYCEKFPKDDSTNKGVYQIWDSNKADNYTYNFPNTVKVIRKNYGLNFNQRIKKIAQNIENSNDNITEGQAFKLEKSNTYLVKINNNHKWFYVNKDLCDLYFKLKNLKVILVGGADFECLTDIYISMKSFGIYPQYNHEYIYSALTNDNQISSTKK